MEEVAHDPSEFRMRREGPRLQPWALLWASCGWAGGQVGNIRDLPPLTQTIKRSWSLATKISLSSAVQVGKLRPSKAVTCPRSHGPNPGPKVFSFHSV